MLGVPGWRVASALIVIATFLLGGWVSPAEVPVVYDSDFGGYVPIVEGIERPDIVADEETGRVPTEIDEARRHTRRWLRRHRGDPPWIASRRLERQLGREKDGPPSSRWVRRHAVVTELVVLGADERPVSGARVFRYYDPSFYTVNEGPDAARLYEVRRYLPAPLPAFKALSLIRSMEPVWHTQRYEPVAQAPLDCDLWSNPWRGPDPAPRRPPIELVGKTDAAGTLTARSGIFNLRDDERFPRAIVPRTVRIGYVVVADGYQLGFSEAPYREGGVRDRRTIHLLRAPGHALLASRELQAAYRLLDAQPLPEDPSLGELQSLVDGFLGRLEASLAKVPPEQRHAARQEVGARLIERLLLRAHEPELRMKLAELAWERTPEHPGRALRLARSLESEPTELHRARALAAEVTRKAPELVEGFELYDRLLVASGAGEDRRRANAERCLSTHPFDPWARSRMAALELRGGRAIPAFDHLRYTFMASPGVGGDVELTRELADYFWRLGLPEKAGTFLWLYTGRPPEDPFVRIRGTGR